MRSAWAGIAVLALGVGCSTPLPSAEPAQVLARFTETQLPAPAPQPPAMPPRAEEPRPQEFNVMLAPGNDPESGRLIVVANPVSAYAGDNAMALAMHSLRPMEGAFVAAQEAPFVTPAQPVRFDADMLADPRPLSRIDPGEYWVQVRLDTNHNAAYAMTDVNDFTSVPVKMTLPSAGPVDVTLLPEAEVMAGHTSPGSPVEIKVKPAFTCNGHNIPAPATPGEADTHMKPFDFVSPAVSAFWGKPMHICGIVLLPPDYETSKQTYPAAYRTEGFGGTLGSQSLSARQHYALMKSGQTPPIIRVFLDHSSPWGTHEFADSANNGPWGKALTEELIPALEKQYRMDAKPSSRFTTGHSSGGWFAIWSQVRYPKVFGGTWARAPDPVDFRSFTGIDLYREGANTYVRPDGSPQYLVRDAQGKEEESFRNYTMQENVLGDYGGQIDSFDWVFSPKGVDGRAQQLFDRTTGKIDPVVATYWRDHFDISYIIRRDWRTLKPVLNGKIHVIIGDTDTFHLNEAAHLLQGELDKLGAKSSFTFVPGGTHFNLDRIDADPMGLEKKIAWEMWAVARPKSKLKPPASH